MDSAVDWNHLRAFMATAETGSLSGAARALHLTQPTLGRQVAALEQDLGLALFERSGRSLKLTDAGRELLPKVRAMAQHASELAMLAEGRAHALDGLIRVTASDMMSAYVLPDILVKLRSMAPKLRVDIIAANDIRDILQREADIAIRHVRPVEPDLIAKLIGDASAHLYAAKSYLDARGRPETPDDLQNHDFIGFGDDDRLIERLQEYGVPINGANLRTGSTSGITTWELMRKGFGLVPMSDDIADGFDDIERVLPDQTSFSFPVWLVTHRDLHTSRRIRLVFDLLGQILSDKL